MQEEVTFVEVTAFGRTAEVIGEYCAKGRPLMVEGRLKLDQWQDKETGQKRSKLGVVAESIQLLGGGQQGGGGNRSARSQGAGSSGEESQDFGGGSPNDEVPF